MTVEYPIAVSILVSYFALIIGLVWRISPQLKQSGKNITPSILLFFGLAAISFLATWTYMFKFFIYSYQQWKSVAEYKYPAVNDFSLINSISYWLHDVSLFDSAWRQVCVGAWQWLWSHQLCSLTVAVWTPILAIEGARRRIPYIWAYMILGQVVAISVASSLFFAVMLSSKPAVGKQPSSTLLWTLVGSTVGGIVTVIISPYVADNSAFMPNLLVMHILLVFPLASKKLIPLPAFSSIKTPVYIMVLYLLAAGANFSIYVNQWIACLSVLKVHSNSFIYDALHMLFTTFFNHPAQSSISSDIVCMQLISMAWMWTHSKNEFKTVPTAVQVLLALTPILSASVTLPLYFAGCEYAKLNFTSRNTIKQ